MNWLTTRTGSPRSGRGHLARRQIRSARWHVLGPEDPQVVDLVGESGRASLRCPSCVTPTRTTSPGPSNAPTISPSTRTWAPRDRCTTARMATSVPSFAGDPRTPRRHRDVHAQRFHRGRARRACRRRRSVGRRRPQLGRSRPRDLPALVEQAGPGDGDGAARPGPARAPAGAGGLLAQRGAHAPRRGPRDPAGRPDSTRLPCRRRRTTRSTRRSAMPGSRDGRRAARSG